jgi:hypothetical protein
MLTRSLRRAFFSMLIVLLCLGVIAGEDNSSDPKSWLACDIDYMFTSYTVGPDFTVTVKSKFKSVSQLKMVLDGEGISESKVVSIMKTTGTDGVARFRAVKPGKYSLCLEELTGPGSAEVTVVSNPRDPDQIVLDWPDIEYSLLNVSGRMISFQDRMPLKGAQVLLLDIPAGHEIARTATDADGHYTFPLPKDGVYVLRFKPSATSDRRQDFGVEVNSVTVKGEMPLLVMDDDKNCGLNVAKAD